jgi:WD40 repeat protein
MVKLKLIFITTLLAVFFISSNACASLEISPSETSHIVAFPLERNFIFSLKISNTGDKDEFISFLPSSSPQKENWLIILPTGTLKISPKEEIEIIATFEPRSSPEKSEEEIKYDFQIEANGIKTIPLTIKYKTIDWFSLPKQGKIKITIFDKETKKPIPDAEVSLSLPSGLWDEREITDFKGAVEFHVPSNNYLNSLYEEYNVATSYTGYFLEVSKEGYKAYYQSEIIPDTNLEIFLEPQKECFEFEKIAEKQTEFSIWWIKASENFEYIVTSAGAHPNPNIKPPKEVAVYFFNGEGKELWRYPISVSNYNNTDVCWGLDITSDGSYVAVGCYDGSVYLLNQKGEMVKKYQASGAVRWLKFSPDNKYLAFGPTKGGPSYFGLFEVPSLDLVWENIVGDWARTVAFSQDGNLVAVGSSNGAFNIFDSKGEKLWQNSNGGLVPFLVGFDKKMEKVATGGKGRNVVVYNISGGVLWNRIIDHVITAGNMAENGAIAVGTVGGMVYYFNPDGKISFRKTHGGVGHNGVYLTKNGKYVLVGGTNPTLFDNNGTILWQLRPGEQGILYSSAEQIGGVNAVMLSEDASLMILGYDDGKIEFWKGKKILRNLVKEPISGDGAGEEMMKEIKNLQLFLTAFFVIIIAGFTVLLLKRKRR